MRKITSANLALMFLGGVTTGAFMVVHDEILTVAMFCGRDCHYPFPFLGNLSLYDAEIVAFAATLGGLLLFVVSFRSMMGVHAQRKLEAAGEELRPLRLIGPGGEFPDSTVIGSMVTGPSGLGLGRIERELMYVQ